jgi:spermidine synthase
MAEASRGFMPRNSGAFADPRGAIVIDDAKSFFAAGRRRYDIIVSEPSNPWVSGVSGLFTREFYRRIGSHLAPGGILVQWIQLYEIDPSLVASVMTALGQEFPHYAVFAPSDHDLLIVAGASEIPAAAQARVFEQPGVAKELWTVHVLTAGDFDARYIGNRATLEPLFASYGMAANSDYAPILDLNAARQRFMEKSATSIVSLVNMDVPALEILEPSRSRRPVNPLFQGAYAFERVENSRLAWYARNFLLGARRPDPESVPAALQKDLELVKLRVIDCREPRELDVWLNSALRVAKSINAYLSPDDAAAVWVRIASTPCFGDLYQFEQSWLTLFRAVGARDTARMAELGARLLSSERPFGSEAREYLLMAAMAGYLGEHQPGRALELWRAQVASIPRAAATPAFRLLRCHAQKKDDSGSCAADFSAYAER